MSNSDDYTHINVGDVVRIPVNQAAWEVVPIVDPDGTIQLMVVGVTKLPYARRIEGKRPNHPYFGDRIYSCKIVDSVPCYKMC
jgi:hypothetical protein